MNTVVCTATGGNMPQDHPLKTFPCIVCGMPSICEDEHEPRLCDEHFVCPKCKATPSSDPGCVVETDCDDDGVWTSSGVNCYNCGEGWDCKGFEKAVAKANSLVPCTCCKGTGYVFKEKEKKTRKVKKDANVES